MLHALKNQCECHLRDCFNIYKNDNRYILIGFDEVIADFTKKCNEIIAATDKDFKAIIKKYRITQIDIASFNGITQQAVSHMINKNFYKREYILKSAVICIFYTQLIECL